MSWPKILFKFSHGMVRKNSNKLFGQTILGFSFQNMFLLVICQCHCDNHVFCIWSFPITFSSVQSVVQSFLTFCNPMDCSTPDLPVHHQLLEFTQTHVHWVSDAIQPSHPLSSPSPPAFNLSQHQCLFKWVHYSYQVTKVLEFQLQHQSFQYSGLISFRMDWLDHLAVQGTLKSLLQHHSSKATIIWCSAFFSVQLSHPYMTIGKTIALTMRTFVGKVMFLLFNMLSRLLIAFLPRSKCLLIWTAINSFNNTNFYFSKDSVVSSFRFIISCNLNKDLWYWPGLGIARKRVTSAPSSQMSVNLGLVSSHISSKPLFQIIS